MQGRHRPASVAGSERRLREIEMIFERAQLVTISATLVTKITKSTRPASSQLEDWAARQRRGHDPRHNKKRVELIAIAFLGGCRCSARYDHFAHFVLPARGRTALELARIRAR